MHAEKLDFILIVFFGPEISQNHLLSLCEGVDLDTVKLRFINFFKIQIFAVEPDIVHASTRDIDNLK